MHQDEKADVAIVGAGLVGLCTAYALRRAGHRVAVFDPNPPGSQCSAGNAGAISSRSVAPLAMPGVLKTAISMLLDPSSALHVPFHYWLEAAPWMAAFVRAARPDRVHEIAHALAGLLAGSVQAHAQLAAQVGCAGLVRSSGQLHLYPDQRAFAKDATSWQLKADHGLRIVKVDDGDIRDLEPEVGPGYRTGVYLPDEGWMSDPLRYSAALAQALRAMDTSFFEVRIDAMRPAGDHWVLRAGARHWHSAKVVVAAGVWSRALLKQQGLDVPLESQRGYHLHIKRPNIELSRVVTLADRKLFITPMDSGLRMAGTVEFAGLDRPPNLRRAMLLGEHAKAGLPALEIDAPDVWMGHRPCLPDSLPVLGPVPQRPGLWCAFGHGHLGLTGSVNTGRLIARAMAGQAGDHELAPFSITRFG